MKKITNIIIALFLLQLNLLGQNISKAEQKLTLPMVKKIAQKYGLQDSITRTKRYFLVYLDEKAVEAYLKKENDIIYRRKELLRYLELTKNVRTYEDDINLINAFPTVREKIVKFRGGEENHKKYIEEARKYKWRIYRDEKGVLSFVKADSPISTKELRYGQRQDNSSR